MEPEFLSRRLALSIGLADAPRGFHQRAIVREAKKLVGLRRFFAALTPCPRSGGALGGMISITGGIEWKQRTFVR